MGCVGRRDPGTRHGTEGLPEARFSGVGNQVGELLPSLFGARLADSPTLENRPGSGVSFKNHVEISIVIQ